VTDIVPLTDDQARRLVAAIETYHSNAEYDTVFDELHAGLKTAGEAGKADIAIVAFWKRLRLDATWVRELLATPEAEVRTVTRAAFEQSTDREALSSLAPLPGFGTWGALATALLYAYDPHRWPVIDKNGVEGLRELGRPVERQPLAYFGQVRQLRGPARLAPTGHHRPGRRQGSVHHRQADPGPT
jgi:hypothetical protein